MDLETAQNNVVAKLPLLKQENGNSFNPVARTTTNADGTSTSTILGLVTTEEKAQKKNDVKARKIGNEEGLLNDEVSIDEEWEEHEYGNPPNDSFPKPYLNISNEKDKDHHNENNGDADKLSGMDLSGAPQSKKINNEQPNEGVCRVDKFEVIKYTIEGTIRRHVLNLSGHAEALVNTLLAQELILENYHEQNIRECRLRFGFYGYRIVVELYNDCRRSQPASDVIAKSGKLIALLHIVGIKRLLDDPIKLLSLRLKFNSIKDAKILMEAIEKRFGGNAATKKTQMNLLNASNMKTLTAPSSEMLDQPSDRL
ncbi:hypothetical protein Tco_0680959 [Tanacetum coccineum]|uniref:Uncharacterized protein n=1 Tax=Tanacetum coccineum TaxID=301880 RepID=A0ABQ4XN39_9ASTR